MVNGEWWERISGVDVDYLKLVKGKVEAGTP